MALTAYRKYTHTALERVPVKGAVLDLGGSKTSGYLKHLKGYERITVVNMDEGARPDIYWNLEKFPYPFDDQSFDTVLAINVLEHLWNWRDLLSEAARIVRPSGTLILVVPFLHAVHPSPNDYIRFTKEALERACSDAGFKHIEVRELGCGICISSYSFFQRFMPGGMTYIFEPLMKGADTFLSILTRMFKRAYAPEDYPLGYIAIARQKA